MDDTLEAEIYAIQNSGFSLDRQLELINELGTKRDAHYESERKRFDEIDRKIKKCDKSNISEMERLIYSYHNNPADVEYYRELRRQKEERDANV